MLEDSNRQKKGLLGSVLTLTDSLLGVAHTRFELLINELEGERTSLLSWLILMQVMLFCVGIGVVLATMVLVLAVDESYRVPVLAAIAIGFIGTGIVAGWNAHRTMQSRPKIFAASLAELKRDHIRPDTQL